MPYKDPEKKKAHNKKYRQKNLEHLLQADRDRWKRISKEAGFLENKNQNSRKAYHKNKEHTMITNAKRRAKKQNIPFDITEEDIQIPTHCPVFGFELKMNCNVQKPNSPSLDKIIPELGYIRGNIQVMSQKANAMKRNASKKDLILFAKWILEEYGE